MTLNEAIEHLEYSIKNNKFSQNMIEFSHKNFCSNCGARMDKE